MALEEIERLKAEEIQEKIIRIEDIFKDDPVIILCEKEIGQFLNGVKLKRKEKEGIYKVYNEKKEFLGTGDIKNNGLKRDVII